MNEIFRSGSLFFIEDHLTCFKTTEDFHELNFVFQCMFMLLDDVHPDVVLCDFINVLTPKGTYLIDYHDLRDFCKLICTPDGTQNDP